MKYANRKGKKLFKQTLPNDKRLDGIKKTSEVKGIIPCRFVRLQAFGSRLLVAGGTCTIQIVLVIANR